jgi:hypothetical protein
MKHSPRLHCGAVEQARDFAIDGMDRIIHRQVFRRLLVARKMVVASRGTACQKQPPPRFTRGIRAADRKNIHRHPILDADSDLRSTKV